ncbi:hypothetical protein EZS27_006126 [termite gut metagenome]|uniref:Uncharacterized protein n=1 Tax=termite gut metagenome TaxID=433724 RepID=A0A5J4SLT1_9ZZZZ
MRAIVIFAFLIISIQWGISQNLKPYILAFETSESISAVKAQVEKNLEQNDIKVIGQYQPASDKNRWIIVISSSELENAVSSIGGLTGFAAALRIGITRENGKTLVSYTNPSYWGNAYFRANYSKVTSKYNALNTKIQNAMKNSGSYVGTPFGSKKGISASDLQKYHYMMGMPYFDDTVELGSFDSYQAAVAKVQSSIVNGVPGVKMVYKVKIPGKNLTLYGFGLNGEEGEKQFMPIIDIGNPKHTAFLPYEILVKDNEVHMLHGRFRIALSFPDLTMMTFSKIMSTPGNIEDALGQVVK